VFILSHRRVKSGRGPSSAVGARRHTASGLVEVAVEYIRLKWDRPPTRHVISGTLRGMTSMTFDLDLIFPIRDVASAELMLLKATCLWNAGIIDDRQRKLVQQQAARFLRGNAIADGNPRTVEMPIQHSDLSCAVSSSSSAAWQAKGALTPSFPS
jgi:hypothetical protein